MTIKRVKLSEARKKKGKSREELLKNMSAEEIKKRANTDPDNPVLTDAQLEEFRLAKKKEKKHEKS
mgnify:CR=1 FL=1